jgi:hypothetical protein
MKHVDLFADFMTTTINLNPDRIAGLESSAAAIRGFIHGSGWAPHIQSWTSQGSWAHKTIIKPVDQGEFDADLLVLVEPVNGWDAATYINELCSSFWMSATYRDKVSRSSHCITVSYANDKKIDVAPLIVNRGGYQRLEVCNRRTNGFELAEPLKYTSWLIQQNSCSGNDQFRKVTRLVKYLRDTKSTFSCPSVLLTTLLGCRIALSDRSGPHFLARISRMKSFFLELLCRISHKYQLVMIVSAARVWNTQRVRWMTGPCGSISTAA